ncbi:hypothetical protein CDEST_02039 [Colletotrichum destructivum]|uniref:Uncharacterized protein n=1 Tax=Colletotrichum destructivum TaxID=34406 RepID=A0AAX4I223_9PEZI|nr:hypothetical protein CDEST_02039 [Colletotrichum destructivum]
MLVLPTEIAGLSPSLVGSGSHRASEETRDSTVVDTRNRPSHERITTATRNAVRNVGRTGSLNNFTQFLCGLIIGWQSDEKKQQAQIDSAVNAGSDNKDADTQGVSDAHGDASEVGGDTWEPENMFRPDVDPSPGRASRWTGGTLPCRELRIGMMRRRYLQNTKCCCPHQRACTKGDQQQNGEREQPGGEGSAMERRPWLISTRPESPSHRLSFQPWSLSPHPTADKFCKPCPSGEHSLSAPTRRGSRELPWGGILIRNATV